MSVECAICHESLEGGGTYTIPECNHCFHTACIVTWFRVNNTCPLCKHTGINQVCVRDYKFYYKKARQWSRRKDAPRDLQEDAEKLRSLERQSRIYVAEQKQLQDTYGRYSTIQKRMRSVRRTNNQISFRILLMKRQLANYAKNMLIIPIKREV